MAPPWRLHSRGSWGRGGHLTRGRAFGPTRSRFFAVLHSLMPMRMVSMVAVSAARRLCMVTPDMQNPRQSRVTAGG